MHTQKLYKFGCLSVTVIGKGVFIGSGELVSNIGQMSAEERKTAYNDAMKQLRGAVRIANAQSNITMYGWNDRRNQLISVAEVVCKELKRSMN